MIISAISTATTLASTVMATEEVVTKTPPTATMTPLTRVSRLPVYHVPDDCLRRSGDELAALVLSGSAVSSGSGC